MVWWGEGAALHSYVRQLWTTLHMCPGSTCKAEPSMALLRFCTLTATAASIASLPTIMPQFPPAAVWPGSMTTG